MPHEQQIWVLMSKTIFGEATPEEEAALQSYLENDAALQQQYDILRQSLLHNTTNEANSDAQSRFNALSIIEKAKRISGEENKVIRPNFKKYFPLIAASIILIVAAGWYFYFQKGAHTNETIEKPAYVTNKGSRQQIVLPDGSKVWMNSDSKLFYTNDFKGNTREVKLIGEAFFDIVKNTNKPFIVHADDVRIKVFGTAFNVKAYSGEGNVETTLYSGLVNITKTDDKTFQPIMLYPNQKIIVPNSLLPDSNDAEAATVAKNIAIQKSIVIQQIDSAITEPQRIETAWMYNRLEFRGDFFEELAKKLERWFNVKITFEDDEVKKLSFNGSFEKENIHQALLALSTANSFNYKIKENEIFIRSKK